MPIIQRPPGALNLSEDIARFCCPDEGFRRSVVVIHVFVNCSNQVLDVPKYAAPDALDGEIAEESLDHVQPRTARGSEMHSDARMSLQPALYFGVFVRRVVIRDEMNLFGFRIDFINHPQESEPFLMPVSIRRTC